MKIRLPSLPNGATDYKIYVVQPRYEMPEDKRTAFQRIMYGLLMKMHHRAEQLCHWCYRVSEKYEPPQIRKTGEIYHEIGKN